MSDAAPLAGSRVLVVEDQMLLAMMMEDMLRKAGCGSVTLASGVERALAVVDAGDLDVAVLDINLEGETSLPVADALLERGIPFMFATGYSDALLGEAYRQQPCLTKPFQEKDLIGTLAALLGGDGKVG